MPAVALNWAVLILLSSCSINDSVREYFQSHDMVYPADVSGIDLLSIKFVGIERDELLEQGAREFVEEGVAFVKEYFKKTDVKSLMAGVEAITISKPVLFRDESGGVGLMVTVTGFGTGSFGSNSKLDPEWIGKDKRFWKVENFAFFNRNEFYKWQFGGWVY